MSNPFISIVIPLFNKQEFIRQCLESLVIQTFSDIEIICVDDCSTDDSLAIACEYSKKDKRIRILCHEVNMGELKSRNTGVVAATGQYIVFLDADDELELFACEKLYLTAKQHSADIYGFGTKIVSRDKNTIARSRRLFKVHNGYLYGRDILQKSMVERTTTRYIWDKMYDSKLCKKAYEIMDEYHPVKKLSPVSADVYGFFIIAYFAKTFFGFEEQLYRYHYGRGIMGSEQLNLTQFERYCMSSLFVKSCCVFFDDQGVLGQYSEIIDVYRRDLLSICTATWKNQIAERDKAEALKIMMSYWPHSDLIELFSASWAEISSQKSWDVPFYLLPKGGRLVLYGAGEMGSDYYRQITDSGVCDIALWVDRDYLALQDSGLQVSAPNDIVNAEFDCILIAVLKSEAASSIKQFLMKAINVPENLIIWRTTSESAQFSFSKSR